METIPILTSTGIFSILTLFYGLIKYFISSSSYPNNSNMSNAIYGFYVVIAIFIQLTININNSKALCDGKSPQIIGAMFHTFLPNLLIFIVIGICIRMFPGWLQPFSNTVGYCFLAVFKNLDWLGDLPTQDNDSALIKKDNSLFLNELTPTNFTSIITKMVKANLINFNETLEENNVPHITKSNSGHKEMVGGRRRKKQRGGDIERPPTPLADTAPLSAPVTAPLSAPLSAPVAAPLSAPVAAPATSAPVAAPLSATSAPVAATSAPVVATSATAPLASKLIGKAGSKKLNKKLSKQIKDNMDKIKFQNLWRLVNIKSVISEIVWFLLCGVLVLAYSYNAILNLECSHSLKQQEIIMKEGDEKLEKLMKENDNS